MRQLKITQSVTNRSTKAVDSYLSDISKIGLITQEREIELSRMIREGNEDALKELVGANLRFVVSVAKQYQNRGIDLLDLINEGNAGLIKAAQKFDETRGFKFISFAVWWIRQSILQAISDNGRLIRVPLNKIGLQNKFTKSFSKLEQTLGRQPNDEEIMQEMGLNKKEISDVLATMSKVQSYDAPMTDDEGSGSLVDLIAHLDGDGNSPDEPLVNTESIKLDIQRALRTLKPLERTVIEKFYGLTGKTAMSLSEIAFEMEYSTERVRQIKESGVRRLRIMNRSSILRKYLN